MPKSFTPEIPKKFTFFLRIELTSQAMKLTKGHLLTSDSMLTTGQAAKMLAVHITTVIDWFDRGLLTGPLTQGGHRRMRAADLVTFLVTRKMPMPAELESVSRRRLLLISSNEGDLRAAQQSIQKFADHAILEIAGNAIDGLLAVGHFQPHIILLDAIMPGLDSVEVCRRLRANPATKTVNIMLVAAHLTDQLESDARKAGVDYCRKKPIDFAEVMKLLGVENNEE
ncbi:MAG: hypothetical protein A2341_26440 [Deltaproteobacteria bacterium RIFOXYB12_FULL_58_9]|nr:MAG: hypothetical protein A2341_26440 [Deltaproteobacteria bacterium RIFOXYB12_FULL_58_9]